MDRNFWVRLASSIAILGSAILFFYFGGIPLFALLAVVSLIGLFELYQAAGMGKTALSAAATAVLFCAGSSTLTSRSGAAPYSLKWD